MPTYNDDIFQEIAERVRAANRDRQIYVSSSSRYLYPDNWIREQFLDLDTSSCTELRGSVPYTIIIDEESDIETCEIQISEDELMAFLEQK